MFQFLLMVSVLFIVYIGYTYFYPLARKYLSYRNEREQLVRQYNRTWRARKDMLVSTTTFEASL